MENIKLKQALETCLTPGRAARRFLLKHGIIKEDIAPRRMERPLVDSFIDGVVTFRSAMLANNPGGVCGLLRSLKIEDAKNECVDDILCDPQLSERIREGVNIQRQCEFTIWDVERECSHIDKALADYKIAERHLDAEVGQGHLRKRTKAGKTVYVKDLPNF